MADQTFYFYDLETTGVNTRNTRIMQFAGQRTDMDLNPVGEPDNILVKLSDDVLPDPRAVMVHKITPQQGMADGISEFELCKFLSTEVFTESTIACGFNSIRFDDEIVRFTFWRNFIDPYEWSYKDGRSRWDIIDLARMTRALRPDGIEWPVVNGKPTNKLEELAKANGLLHEKAHDALSDVLATIELAKLIKQRQPKLFDHYFGLRDKSQVSSLISKHKMFVHTSGMLSSAYDKTTIVTPIAPHPTNSNMILVYDLRHDPTELTKLSTQEIQERLFTANADLLKQKKTRLPIKGISINKSPAVAPITVLDDDTWERIQLDEAMVSEHLKTLSAATGFTDAVVEAYSGSEFEKPGSAEEALYSGFVSNTDKAKLKDLSVLSSKDLFSQTPVFDDTRLNEMWFYFVARNAPEELTPEEKERWEKHIRTRIEDKAPTFGRILQAMANDDRYSSDEEAGFILEELHLYLQSLADHDY